MNCSKWEDYIYLKIQKDILIPKSDNLEQETMSKQQLRGVNNSDKEERQIAKLTNSKDGKQVNQMKLKQK